MSGAISAFAVLHRKAKNILLVVQMMFTFINDSLWNKWAVNLAPCPFHRKVSHLELPRNGTKMRSVYLCPFSIISIYEEQLFKSTVENILIYIA
ncbi:hypothetical protein T05_4831 [Trichinella murrelli]|uniref:Uncharacterized protein n=1 Tax=Trichinella murrelli TaxID=144512 RepID=A0A0V0TYM7_9BILA|nr:hypothetical protein T05_14067 [Trichinella murrelli]KRX44129.1 hypothetical protein T05_4831 [Trichinella murrelli]